MAMSVVDGRAWRRRVRRVFEHRCDQNFGIAAVTAVQREEEETALAIVVLFVVGVGGSSSARGQFVLEST
jgi:hypothetical protein